MPFWKQTWFQTIARTVLIALIVSVLTVLGYDVTLNSGPLIGVQALPGKVSHMYALAVTDDLTVGDDLATSGKATVGELLTAAQINSTGPMTATTLSVDSLTTITTTYTYSTVDDIAADSFTGAYLTSTGTLSVTKASSLGIVHAGATDATTFTGSGALIANTGTFTTTMTAATSHLGTADATSLTDTGTLTAASATITNALTSASVATGPVTATTLYSTGALTANSAAITNTATAAAVSATNITATTGSITNLTVSTCTGCGGGSTGGTDATYTGTLTTDLLVVTTTATIGGVALTGTEGELIVDGLLTADELYGQVFPLLIRLDHQHATCTNGAVFTPTGSLILLTASADVTPTIAVMTDDGWLLILENTSSYIITIAEDTNTKVPGASIALGQYDSALFVCDGNRWIYLPGDN